MFSIVFLITAIFTFEGMDQAYFTYHTDMAFLSEELCDNHISKKGEEVIVSLEEHYLGEENNFPPTINKDDYVAFRIECQPYIWDNESLTPMRYSPVEPKEELPSV